MTEIKNIFIDCAIKHGEAIDQGNYKLANKLHSKLTSLYEKIKKEEQWDELKIMVKHTDESVKLWTATFLLKRDTDLALKVLNELRESKRIIGLTASTTVDMWNKGMLQL
jgi:hypothetical protein